MAEKHRKLHKKIQQMSATLEELPFDGVIAGAPSKKRKGVITSGPVSNYVKTVVNEKEATLPVFKIGTLYPFPRAKINNFLEALDEVLVVEEVDPWIEKRVAMVSNTEQKVRGKLSGDISREGPINREDVRNAIERLIGIREHAAQWDKRSAAKSPKWKDIENCPMKDFYGMLRNAIDSIDEKVIVLGDTGCGYQGTKHPYETIDSFLCMGGSVSMAAGANIAGFQGNAVAVMGDSFFLHSGIQSLMNAVYHDADVTFLIFDNRMTGETGRQPNLGTGKSLQNEEMH